MDEIDSTADREVLCIKDWAPELFANPMFECLCPRCFPFTFAARQAEILQQVTQDDGDDGRDSDGS